VTVVLDTWAVIGLLNADPGGESVNALLKTTRPVMSWVNLGEVDSLVYRRRGEREANRAVSDLRSLLTTDEATAARVLEAARMKANHRLSCADAFAAATAIAHDAELWTGDPELLVTDAPWRWHDLR
jgi:predicted nucleic acid-binding protein